MAGKWFVRGIPEELARAVAAAAKAQGITVGRWVAQALETHLRRTEPPPSSLDPEAVDAHAVILQRLEALEARLPPLPSPRACRSAGGRPQLPTEVLERIRALATAGIRPAEIVAATGVSRASVYRHLPSSTKRSIIDKAEPANERMADKRGRLGGSL
jgi:uncharacterized membrane protein